MGCCSSSASDEKPKNADEFKLLLLGPASSGKSTFSKQMKLLYSGGFDQSEITLYRDALLATALDCFQQTMEKASEDSVDPASKEAFEFLKSQSPWAPLSPEQTREVFTTMLHIYHDEKFKALLAEFTQTGSHEAFVYVLENLERFKDPSWTPTNDDILHARSRTTGFSTMSFQIGTRTWSVIDVGGQKVERKKWIHARGMEIDALIYFCPIGDYCIPSEEDPDKTKLEESLEIWDEVMNGDGLGGIPVILFFNKKDLLESRLGTHPPKKFIKTYDGKSDYDKVTEFVKKMFLGRVREGAVSKAQDVYIQQTCAVDTENIRAAFDSIRDWMVKQFMEMAGVRELFSDD